MYLVIAATTNRRVNAAISFSCLKKGILINVVDSPGECNFILPSVVRRGPMTISISTEGISPAMAKKIRQDLERQFGFEYAKLLHIIKEIRPRALKKLKSLQSKKAFFQKALQPEIFGLIKKHKQKQAKRKLERILKDAT